MCAHRSPVAAPTSAVDAAGRRPNATSVLMEMDVVLLSGRPGPDHGRRTGEASVKIAGRQCQWGRGGRPLDRSGEKLESRELMHGVVRASNVGIGGGHELMLAGEEEETESAVFWRANQTVERRGILKIMPTVAGIGESKKLNVSIPLVESVVGASRVVVDLVHLQKERKNLSLRNSSHGIGAAARSKSNCGEGGRTPVWLAASGARRRRWVRRQGRRRRASKARHAAWNSAACTHGGRCSCRRKDVSFASRRRAAPYVKGRGRAAGPLSAMLGAHVGFRCGCMRPKDTSIRVHGGRSPLRPGVSRVYHGRRTYGERPTRRQCRWGRRRSERPERTESDEAPPAGELARRRD